MWSGQIARIWNTSIYLSYYDINTVTLTGVDWFSKTTQLIPLPNVLTIKETAEVMLHHVFQLHGLPSDVVSDQLTSCFWSDFCRLLGTALSLSSSFHLLSNGQAKCMNQEMDTALRSTLLLVEAIPVDLAAVLERVLWA